MKSDPAWKPDFSSDVGANPKAFYIKVTADSDWGETVWDWEVWDSHQRVKLSWGGDCSWRWSAKFAAKKAARRLSKGKPAPGPTQDPTLDFYYFP